MSSLSRGHTAWLGSMLQLLKAMSYLKRRPSLPLSASNYRATQTANISWRALHPSHTHNGSGCHLAWNPSAGVGAPSHPGGSGAEKSGRGLTSQVPATLSGGTGAQIYCRNDLPLFLCWHLNPKDRGTNREDRCSLSSCQVGSSPHCMHGLVCQPRCSALQRALE